LTANAVRNGRDAEAPWRSGVGPLVMLMKSCERWRHQYRQRRYMVHLTEKELQQRAKDVFLNLLVLTEENKIGFPPIDDEGSYWMVRWADILEEFVLRYGPYPAGFKKGFIKEVRIPRPDDPLAPKAAQVVKSLDRSQLKPGTFLVKYGKAEHLRQAFEKGVIRIAPAASMDDPSLNPAIRDRELEVYVQPPPSEMKLHAYDGKTGKPKGVFNPVGNRVRRTSRTNYYVYCLSGALAPRLFIDFDYDSFLIFAEPAAFVKNLLQAVEAKLPKWTGAGMPVKYYDPLNSRLEDIDIFSQKHFRFAYQKEYRIIWLPPREANDLQPVIVELGSLEGSVQVH